LIPKASRAARGTQELGPEWHWVSEALFAAAAAAFALWTLSPYVARGRHFYSAVLWMRILLVLVGERRRRLLIFQMRPCLAECHMHSPAGGAVTL
jgi:hypothetical protein